MVMLFVFVWLRGTLPRLRYDQFMRFGWKVLIPISIVWILLVSTWRGIRNEYGTDLRTTLIWLGVILFAIAAIAFIVDMRRAPQEEPVEPKFDPYAGGYPVPPLPGQEFTFTRRARQTVPATVVESEAIEQASEGDRNE